MESGTNPDEFLCGVIEGFYGNPWAFEQRHDLFGKLNLYGLNTYVYAPKDDLKHRERWRVPYNDSELVELKNLVDGATTNRVNFVYALSPGKDMVWEDEQEIEKILDKLVQLKSLGCSAFALLFDDIDKDDADRERISRTVMKQVNLTNRVYEAMNKSLFLFCPTEYSSNKAVPNLEESTYLKKLGENLNEDIYILWTGTNVVPQQFSIDHIKQVANILKRKPLLWDNYFANDYDYGFNRLLFLGPIDGRSIDLKQEISGLLINPNCQYEANFIPIYTLGEWHGCKNTRQSYERGLTCWLDEFHREIETNDIRLLADIFYLPFTRGNSGVEMLKNVRWLFENTRETDEWNMKFHNLQTWFGQITKIFRLLNNFFNKHLAKEIYPFVQEAQFVLAVVLAVLDSIRQSNSFQPPKFDGIQSWEEDIIEIRWWPMSQSFKGILPDLFYQLQKILITSKNALTFFPLDSIQKTQRRYIELNPKCYAYCVWKKFSANFATMLYKKFAPDYEKEVCTNIIPSNQEQFYFDKHFGYFFEYGCPSNLFVCEKFVTHELKQLFSTMIIIVDVKKHISQYKEKIFNKYMKELQDEAKDDEFENKIQLLTREINSWLIFNLPDLLLEKYPSMIYIRGPLDDTTSIRGFLQIAVAILGFQCSPGFFLCVSNDDSSVQAKLLEIGLNLLESDLSKNFVFGHAL